MESIDLPIEAVESVDLPIEAVEQSDITVDLCKKFRRMLLMIRWIH